MGEYPYLPFDTDAWIAATRHLTVEQRGAYFELLLFAWRSSTNDLPNDPKQLAQMLGISGHKWRSIAPKVLPFFDEESGRLTQKRLKKTRKNVSSLIEKKRKAGIASAKARALKNNKTKSTGASTGGSTNGQQTPDNKNKTISKDMDDVQFIMNFKSTFEALRQGRYVAPSTLTPDQARRGLKLEQITTQNLRDAGITF